MEEDPKDLLPPREFKKKRNRIAKSIGFPWDDWTYIYLPIHGPGGLLWVFHVDKLMINIRPDLPWIRKNGNF